jgi:hypothetical protein
MIPQDIHLYPDPVVPNGMHVWFLNEYSRLHVLDGRLISTIIAYYLTFTALLLPLLALDFREWRQRDFTLIEIVLLAGLSVFAIYISDAMGRRTVLLMLIVAFGYLVFYQLAVHLRQMKIKTLVVLLIFFIAVGGIGYCLIVDTEVFHRILDKGLHDRRFGFWLPGLKAMWTYPFGGGHGVFVAHNMKLAHNTWIDIGKDFGVIPFFAFVVFSFIHARYLLGILLYSKVSIFMKHLLLLMSLSFFVIMMVEPVFTSDKTFFAYMVFFSALLKQYADKTYNFSKIQKIS